MMTTNKLTKTFASGSLAIGVLAGAVLTATSASAAVLTWGEWTSGQDLIQGDKIVKYVGGTIGAEAVDKVALTQMGDHYYFRYDAMDGLADTNKGPGGSFTYTIGVTDPNKSIVGVDLDSNVSSNYGTVTETFGEISNVLVSTNGSQVPPSGFIGIPAQTLLTVTNTLVNTNPGTEGLFDIQNSFHQTTVPEPGTILGLLAVGGLGLVSRFKKQK
ncbi:MAG: PEP-CTERM sorting domain-containing protein [Microcystis sp. M048S1]|uniref:PEP-CTERM sorting domain-containing protein n=1 Tax=unclassified Microcystis TaxID=2643300 RepID=UPI0011921BDA|nr:MULTISPECIES: PEP-CTERM sorting domain-containing protein [unclassified Microcystis]MCA2899679.1 PEP-CTERM sorting domain-containing protein [Microcystis sp. M035S1]MCA2721525.1 PEP-CTERM sorting domain-containing protein [Microcystis sp. M176S2]MCA2725704.1 PEP-CTERM sorting domain-containing protein [Microcystis sp. M166S2]MCA2732051.1 PEP-CTERM sorting domain-containing protein [Microcystis sp. M162S2]MCA2748659.1 PEP-CTERM sorting domain-containing protein [Microcystis sp. M155S2]